MPDDILRPPALSVGCQQSIEVLTRLLREAEAGRVPGFAVILPRGGQVEVQMVGQATAQDLYFGAGLLQDRLLAAVAPRDGGSPKVLIGAPR